MDDNHTTDLSSEGIKKSDERNKYFRDMADDSVLPFFPFVHGNMEFWKTNKQRDVLRGVLPFFLVDKKGKLFPPAKMLSRSGMDFDEDKFCLVGDILCGPTRKDGFKVLQDSIWEATMQTKDSSPPLWEETLLWDEGSETGRMGIHVGQSLPNPSCYRCYACQENVVVQGPSAMFLSCCGVFVCSHCQTQNSNAAKGTKKTTHCPAPDCRTKMIRPKNGVVFERHICRLERLISSHPSIGGAFASFLFAKVRL